MDVIGLAGSSQEQKVFHGCLNNWVSVYSVWDRLGNPPFFDTVFLDFSMKVGYNT